MKNYILALTIFLSSCSFEQANDEEVVIYTSRQPQLIENLLNVFAEETGIQVTVLSGDAQQLMERIAVEGVDTDADIFMTVDAESCGKLQIKEYSIQLNQKCFLQEYLNI